MENKNKDNKFCAECGAPLVNGMNCWEQLGGIIAWEYQDAELLAEHFKTVASYNIQHPAMYTEEAVSGLKKTLIEHLDEGLTIAEIRKRNGKAYNGKKKVRKNEEERHPVLRKWRMTIADVYIPDCPEGAAQRVRDWAMSIKEEL